MAEEENKGSVSLPENGNAIQLKTIEGAPVTGNSSADQVVKAQRKIIKSFRSRYSSRRRWYDRVADFMTEQFGTIWFLAFNLLVFVLWICWNADIFSWLPKFDPYPHNFLTMVVSLEAIFLSIVVLISQNRQSNIADMREEIDFNINVRAEQEITKILSLVDRIDKKLTPDSPVDQELLDMEIKTDIDEIERQIAEEYGTRGQ
jgi:uncharacterized membrane protein